MVHYVSACRQDVVRGDCMDRHSSADSFHKNKRAPLTLPGLACLCAREKVASFDCQLVTISFHLCGRICTLKPRTGEKVSVQVPGVK